MLHLSKISKNGKEFNLIASGALAFKVYNKILKDATYDGCEITSCSMLSEQALEKFYDDKKVYFTLVSDLDHLNTEKLCSLNKIAREKGSYTVCQVVAMFYNERHVKAIKQLRKNYNEVVEVSKLCLGDSKSLAYTEQQTCLITNFSLSLARMMFHVCTDTFEQTKSADQEFFLKQIA